MKFSWGKAIFAAYGFFILGVIAMVSISLTKSVDLVAPNYYDKAISYQEEIDRITNANKLKEPIRFDISGTSIVLNFPNNSPASVINGEIVFFRPSDSRKDFRVNVETDNKFAQVIDISNLDGGLWKIKIFWNMDGIDYLSNYNFMKP